MHILGLKRVVVVGGGPAGIMAAIRASELKADVTLVEKNTVLGKKLLLSGKGRCNLTNLCDLDSFLKKFSKDGQFLREALKIFFNVDLVDFFNERGIELKTEEQLRVFPVTNKASSILELLEKELRKNKVNILFEAKAENIIVESSQAKGLVLANGASVLADKIILAAGGMSYSFTGSTGDGWNIAKKLGHHIVNPRPGLLPLEVKQQYPKLLEGLSLKDIRLKFSDGKRKIISEAGDLMFTDKGISGPLVLSLSGKIIDWLNEDRDVFVEIDLKPEISCEQIDKQLLKEFNLNSKKSIKNILKDFLPHRLADVFLDVVEIESERKISQINQQERRRLSSLFKSFRLDIAKSYQIEQAMVTQGGVSLKEINPRTMESRLIKGLYFAGEMIDVDADTGGFNLQAAFSTGYLAGESSAQ